MAVYSEVLFSFTHMYKVLCSLWEHIFRLHYIRVVYSKVIIVNIYFIASHYVVCCIKVCYIQVLLYSNTYVKVRSSLLLKIAYVIVELELKKVITNVFPFIWTSKKRRKRKL